MVICIDMNAFENSNFFSSISTIIQLVEDQKHRLYIKKKEDVDKIIDSKWFSDQVGSAKKPLLEEFIIKTFVDSETNSVPKKIVQLNIQDGSLQSLTPLLSKPLYIVLENSESDGVFIRTLARVFKNKARKINRALESGWIILDNAGGTNMIIPRVTYLTRINVRVFVLTDSDKKYPACPLEGSIKEIKEYCETHNIAFHILNKREIENYIPLEALKTLSVSCDDLCAAIESLKPEQADYYDLEKGFSNKSLPQAHHKSLFDDLLPGTFNVLRNSFDGRGVHKNQLFPLFESDKTTRERLLEKCAHQEDPNELHKIIDSINEIL